MLDSATAMGNLYCRELFIGDNFFGNKTRVSSK